MSIEIREVKSASERKQFVQFVFDLYKDSKFWVPPMRSGELAMLSPESNPSFDFCDAKFWLAFKNNKVVGRIGGIINHKYNEKMSEKTGRFTRIEFIDDAEVVSALLKTAEKWLKEKGMVNVHGPLGFNNLDAQAILIEGFDKMPSIASVYHLPYYQKHIEAMGYEKEVDWLEFRLFISKEIPEKALRLNDLIKKRNGYTVKVFTSIKAVMPYTKEIFRVLNSAFEELFSVVAFDQKLIDFYTKKYISMLNPRFIKLVFDKDEKLAGFIIGVPSLSEAMQKAGGKLFPFGFYHIMKALKHPKVVDLFLTAVEPQHQGAGLPAILITELQKTLIEHEAFEVETTGMIETNQKAIQYWKNFDHIQHKRKRCFKKKL